MTINNNHHHFKKKKAPSSYYKALALVFPCVNKDWSQVVATFPFDLGQW